MSRFACESSNFTFPRALVFNKTDNLCHDCIVCTLHYPRANGAKRRARVLIPHGYLHPGKGKHSEV